MNTWIVKLFCLLALVLSAGCASVTKSNESIQPYWEASLVPGLSSTRDKPVLLGHQGELFQVRYAGQDQLVVQNLKSRKEGVVGLDATEDSHFDGVSSFSDAKNIYVAWRSKLASDSKRGLGKTNDKMVYVSASPNGIDFSPAKRISNGNGAFHPTITGNGSGDVYAVWQDERSGPNYDIYFNVSHDHGANWKQKDVRLDIGKDGESFSAEPSLKVEGNRLWLTWVEAGKEGCGIYVRASADRGDTWNEAVQISKCGDQQAFFPQIVRIHEKTAVYWYGVASIKGAWSGDNGATWTDVPPLVEISEPGVTLQELTVKADSTGVVHILYGKKGDAKGARSNTYYTRSEDGVRFSESVRLNSGDEYGASAILPTVALDGEKTMVAWMDYRFFRPVVIGAYSTDKGKTWGHDFLMDNGPAAGTSQFPYLLGLNDKWWLSFINYDLANMKTMERGKAWVVEVVPEAPTPAAKLSLPDTSKLTSRVKDFWNTRVNADWAASYEFMDPFMRAKTPKEKYIASQGLVKYYGFEYMGFDMVKERVARVKVKYTSEVPEMEINNRKYSVPKRDEESNQEWIWVDGNWYVTFVDLFGGTFQEL